MQTGTTRNTWTSSATATAITLTVALVAVSFVQPISLLFYGAAIGLALLFLAAGERAEYALVMLVGAAALDVTGRIATIGPLKLTAYQGLAALFVLLLAYRVWTTRSTLKRTPIDAAALLYLSLVFISIVSALDKSTALVQAVSLASSVLLAYGVAFVADDEDKLTKIILGTLIVSVGIGLLGIAENFELYSVTGYLKEWNGGTIRAKATFKDPNIMGSFQLTAIALAMPLLLVARKRLERIILLGALLIAAAGLATTASRGALGGLAVSLVIVLVLSRVKFTTKIGIALGVAALTLLAVTYVANPQWVESRVINVDEDMSALSRVYMADSAIGMALDNPTGIGIGNYSQLYPYYRNALVRPDLIESHTAYLTILVEIGVLGLLAFLAVLMTYAFAVFRVTLNATVGPKVHAAAVGSLAAVVGLSAQAFTYSLESSKFWWLAIGVGLAAYLIARASNSADSHTALSNGESTS